MTTYERELLLSLAKVLIDGAGYEERAKIDRLREAVEREGHRVPLRREPLEMAAAASGAKRMARAIREVAPE